MKINAIEYLKDTPRPHYLFGMADYNRTELTATLTSEINFTSKDHPSISDRTDKYVTHPHVNAGDCCFAVWNATHIIAEYEGWGERILRKEITMQPKKIIPPNTKLTLETKIQIEKELQLKGKTCAIGTLYASIFDEKNELFSLQAQFYAQKPPKPI